MTEIVPLVMRDLEERYRVGMERYGVPLTVDTKKDALVEAYEEALDLCVYLRLELERRNPTELPEPIPSVPLVDLIAGTYAVALSGMRTFGPDGAVRQFDRWSTVQSIHRYQQANGSCVWKVVTVDGEAEPIYTHNDGRGYRICARRLDG